MKFLATPLPKCFMLQFKEFSLGGTVPLHVLVITVSITSYWHLAYPISPCDTRLDFLFFSCPYYIWLCEGESPCPWMTWQHNASMACWGGGCNPTGDGAAALIFRVLWVTTASYWHLLFHVLLVLKTYCLFLLFLISKLSVLDDFPCGWNARQKKKKNILGLSDVVPGNHQHVELLHHVFELWDALPSHWHLLLTLPSCPPRPLLSIFPCPY